MLQNYLGGASVAGGKMKETGTLFWASPNMATNSSGFTALSGGIRSHEGEFGEMGYTTGWWSSTAGDEDNAWSYGLYYGANALLNIEINRRSGLNVRCVKD